MSEDAPHIFLSVGDPSGDAHGAAVAAALKRRWPRASLYGLGGPRMEAEGVELLEDFQRLNVMGFAEVLRHLPFFLGLLRRVGKELERRRTDLVLPVDYPGFNLRLARAAHASGIPVLYYIAPQVWAWHRSRARQLAEAVDRLAVVFPFEVPFFQDHGVDTTFVGHPLLDREHAAEGRTPYCARLGLDPDRPILALFPGSRRQEVERHLEAFQGAADRVVEARPAVQPVIAAAADVPPARFEGARYPVTWAARDLLDHARAALVKSGTTTLETALAGVPMVVAYRTHPVTYFIARRLVDVDHVGMVNLVAGERLMPELLQDAAVPGGLAGALLPLLDEGEERERVVLGLAGVRDALRGEGATSTAAERVVELAAGLLEWRR